MKVTNLFPKLLENLKKWGKLPAETEFNQNYTHQFSQVFEPLLGDFEKYRGISFYQQITSLDWAQYRNRVLKEINPDTLEKNIRVQIEKVESLLGTRLKGEVVLIGAFGLMDGYARFHQGTHQVFLGLDDVFPSSEAKNVLITHELTHVAREGRPQTWIDFGLDPSMDHDAMTEVFPAIEHLFSEGFSCLVSELLHPGLDPAYYVYQSVESYAAALKHAQNINEVVHGILSGGHYTEFYNINHYERGVPRYAHYLWAWQWVKNIYSKKGGDIQKVLNLNAKNLVQDALEFHLLPEA